MSRKHSDGNDDDESGMNTIDGRIRKTRKERGHGRAQELETMAEEEEDHL